MYTPIKRASTLHDENVRLKRKVEKLQRSLDEVVQIPVPMRKPRIMSRMGRNIGEMIGTTRVGTMLGGPSGLGLIGGLAGSTSGRYMTLKEKEEFLMKLHGQKTANTVQQAEKETDRKPSDAQIEAGNYKKGKFRWQGMDISVENPKGSYREGTDRNGKKWRTKLHYTYGYIKRTVGRDKEHVDVFVGEDLDSDKVYIINQVNPGTRKFDEHKVMIGFDNKEDAKKGYLKNYEAGWKGLGKVTIKSINEFKEWLDGGDMDKEAKKKCPKKGKTKKTAELAGDYIRRYVREKWAKPEDAPMGKCAGLKRIMRLQAASGKGTSGVSEALRRALGKQYRRADTYARKHFPGSTVGDRQYPMRTMDSAAVRPGTPYWNPTFFSVQQPGARLRLDSVRENLPTIGRGGDFKRY